MSTGGTERRATADVRTVPVRHSRAGRHARTARDGRSSTDDGAPALADGVLAETHRAHPVNLPGGVGAGAVRPLALAVEEGPRC